MLSNYLKAERLKFKRSLFQKLMIFIPAAVILTTVILRYVGMGFSGFSGVMACNWCMPIASLSIVFLCHLINKKEQKHQYRTLYSLPIDLRKTFISKTILVAVNLLIISLVLALFTTLFEWLSSDGLGLSGFYMGGYFILGYFVLWLSLLWQIPFCLFLDQKVGFVGSVMINLIASAMGGLFFYLTPIFWLYPYSWPARFMATFFGVLTNGLPVAPDSRVILSLAQSVLLLLISLLAVVIFTVLFSRWFKRQVYRK